MRREHLAPADKTVLVVLNRLEPAATTEKARMEVHLARANAQRPDGTLRYRYVNTLTDNPEELTRQAFLKERHVAAVVLGSSNGDHTATDNPNQQTFDRYGLPIVKELMESDLPVFGECYGDQAMARAIGGRVVRDPRRQEGATHPVTLTPLGELHVAYRGTPKVHQRILGHKDSALPPTDQVEVLGTTNNDALSVWASKDGKKLAEQGHPTIEDGRVAEAAFSGTAEGMTDPSLAPYTRTGEFIDTPGSGFVVVNFMLAAASGTREWFGESDAA